MLVVQNKAQHSQVLLLHIVYPRQHVIATKVDEHFGAAGRSAEAL